MSCDSHMTPPNLQQLCFSDVRLVSALSDGSEGLLHFLGRVNVLRLTTDHESEVVLLRDKAISAQRERAERRVIHVK